MNPETEGPNGKPIACPFNKFTSGALCEFADGYCIPQGTRTVIFGSAKVKETSPCTWNFGNTIQGVTPLNFGGDAQYGLPELSRFGGTNASAVFLNPETTTALGCGPIKEP